MDNIYLNELVKQAGKPRNKQSSGPARAPVTVNYGTSSQPTIKLGQGGTAPTGFTVPSRPVQVPGTTYNPLPPTSPSSIHVSATPTASVAGSAATGVSNSQRVKDLVDQATDLYHTATTSPMGKRVIKAGKDLAGGTVGLTAAGIAGKYAPVARQTAEHVFDNLVERVAPGMTPKSLDPAALGDKIISAIDNATAHKVIPPAPPVPKGMSLPAKLALGAATLGTTGLLGYGATRGYVNMNKEAFAKSLLEQGYSVEDTLALVKEAKEKDNSYGATLSNDIRTGARIGFGVGGLMGGGLGLLATNAARAANPNLSKLHYLTSGLLGAGVVGGATALPAAVGGALFSVPHQAGKYLFSKEAYAKGLLEQGYSVEDTLELVKEASLLGKIKELPERYARGAVLTATAPLAIPAAHSMDMVRAVRRAQGLGHEGEDIAKYTNAVTGDIKTFIGGTGALAAAGYAAKKLLDRAAANKASRMAAESIKQEAASGMSNAEKALLGAAGSIGAGTTFLRKEAFAKSLLEQGYSVEDTLALVKEAGFLSDLAGKGERLLQAGADNTIGRQGNTLVDKYLRGMVLTPTAPISIPGAMLADAGAQLKHNFNQRAAIRKGLSEIPDRDRNFYTKRTLSDIGTFVGGTAGMSHMVTHGGEKLMDKAVQHGYLANPSALIAK